MQVRSFALVVWGTRIPARPRTPPGPAKDACDTSRCSLLLASSLAALCRAQSAPPAARRIPKVDTLHGDVRVDDYFWLREKTNPEVIAHLEAENAWTAAGHAAHRGAAGAAVPGDRRPHQGDGPVGPGARGQVGVLQPHRAGEGLSDLLAPAGRTLAPTSCCSTRTCSPRDKAYLSHRAARREPRRPAPAVPAGHDRLPRVHALREGPRERQRWSTRSRTSGAAPPGPTTAAPSST